MSVGSILAAALAIGLVGSGPPAHEPRDFVFHQNVEWSPDGSRIAYSELTDADEYSPSNWSIWVADPDGTNRRRVATDAIWASWSPDGTKLAFASRRDGDSDLYVVGVDGEHLRQLTDDPATDTAPAWSPSGETLAFTSDRDGDEEIYLLDVESREVRRLTHDPANDFNPQWSPDGKALVFYREMGDGMDQVFTVDLEGRERRITHDRNLNAFPSFLPDGRIAFSSKAEGGEGRLVVVGPDGDERTLVGPSGAFFGRWSPDGKEVLYVSGSWPTSSVYRMHADGTGSQRIVN